MSSLAWDHSQQVLYQLCNGAKSVVALLVLRQVMLAIASRVFRVLHGLVHQVVGRDVGMCTQALGIANK